MIQPTAGATCLRTPPSNGSCAHRRARRPTLGGLPSAHSLGDPPGSMLAPNTHAQFAGGWLERSTRSNPRSLRSTRVVLAWLTARMQSGVNSLAKDARARRAGGGAVNAEWCPSQGFILETRQDTLHLPRPSLTARREHRAHGSVRLGRPGWPSPRAQPPTVRPTAHLAQPCGRRPPSGAVHSFTAAQPPPVRQSTGTTVHRCRSQAIGWVVPPPTPATTAHTAHAAHATSHGPHACSDVHAVAYRLQPALINVREKGSGATFLQLAITHGTTILICDIIWDSCGKVVFGSVFLKLAMTHSATVEPRAGIGQGKGQG